MIEVEKRTFITEEKYHELIKKFKATIKTTKQITYYFKGDKDFRLMLTPTYTKLWLKEGEIHDDYRREYEVFVNQENNESLLGMLSVLGYEIDIKWYRVRNEFNYQGMSIAIDYTHGYGYILEAELLVDNEIDIEAANNKIIDFFNKLNIDLVDKQMFKDKYKDYIVNWQKYTQNINENEFLK